MRNWTNFCSKSVQSNIYSLNRTKICTVICSAALSGCALIPNLSGTANNVLDEASGRVMIGSHLTIHNTDERLTLSKHIDALSADGLYYASWLAAGRSNYEVISEDNINCNGQSYSLITYQFTNTENPYDHGVSVFGVYEDTAVCMELTCVKNYNEDLRQMLTDFLGNCTYE